jgi:predicted peroxiredoxin
VAYGSTSGALGTAWGWYSLSPKWNSVWNGDGVPASYANVTTMQANGKPILRKVAVIMSDGVYNTMRGWKDQDQQTVSNHAKQLCANMKAKGIEIFTVGLALDQLSASERAIAEDTLMSCGTDIHHFYSTLNVAELQTAFQDIAYQLTSVALAR